jgi:hypothetical protein
LTGLLIAILLPVFYRSPWSWALLGLFGFYLVAVAVGAALKSANLKAGLLAPVALLVQYAGYGMGFLKSSILLTFSKKKPEALMPQVFFNP